MKKATINESMYSGRYFAVAMPKLDMEDQIASLHHDLCNTQRAVLDGPLESSSVHKVTYSSFAARIAPLLRFRTRCEQAIQGAITMLRDNVPF